MTYRAVSGTLTSQAAGDAFRLTELPKRAAIGQINLAIHGTFVGTVRIECSFDNATWIPLAKDPDGAQAAYTSPLSLVIDAPEVGVYYRVNCTSYTSGTIGYRLSV